MGRSRRRAGGGGARSGCRRRGCSPVADDAAAAGRPGRTGAATLPLRSSPSRWTVPVLTPIAMSSCVGGDGGQEQLGHHRLVVLAGRDPEPAAALLAAHAPAARTARREICSQPFTWRPARSRRCRCRPPAAGRAGSARTISSATSARSAADLAVGHLEQQLVVDLQHQPGAPALVAQPPVAADHRHLDDVGGAALHDRVHRQPLAQAARLAVGRAQLGDRPPAAEQGGHVAVAHAPARSPGA